MTDWPRYCRAAELSVEEPFVTVEFANGRRHKVRVVEAADSFLVFGVVATQRTLDEVDDVALRAWRRNRLTTITGFRIETVGDRRRLVGEALVPKAGLTPEEFRLYVRKVAVECDEFEYVLTGRDVE